MPQDGEGEPGALLRGVEGVVGVEEVLLDLGEPAVELQTQPRVVQRAVLDPPVVAGVAQHAVVQRGERLAPRGREGVQGPVATTSLEEAEQGAAGRYVWFEHEAILAGSG